MLYSGYEMVWLFFVYSFLGWIMETVAAAIKQKRFVNRGLVNAPLCVIYGFSALVVTTFCNELDGFWLFAGGLILSTVIEWTAGHCIERIFHERWWDYGKIKGNLDGYICLPMSVIWGLLCVFVIKWGNAGLTELFNLLPGIAGKILIWGLSGILFIDIAATLCILSGRSRRIEQWKGVDSWLTGISSNLGRKIYGWIDRRIRRAYPYAREKAGDSERKKEIFAYGCSFYKIVWLFVIGAFLGDIVETLFCRATMGVWMSRSSVVWGPFSIVWGIAIAAATLLLYKYKERSDRFIFIAGTCLGGAYEYACSVCTELMFGKVFWDYSKIPFNLGGRINLLYCFFWGIAAVIWIKGLYPLFSSWIERIPVKTGKILSWLMIVFFCCNIAVSCMALVRSNQRVQGVEAEHKWQMIMDEKYDDSRLKRIYPKAIQTD
ncbi:MAG: putative ABC transporter permease [Ruminococcus sp.]|jgi:uncharacterized membrane protein